MPGTPRPLTNAIAAAIDTRQPASDDADVEEALARYVGEHLPSARDVVVSGLVRIPGGASRETWAFDVGWREGESVRQESFVLRKDPPGSLVESDRELEYAFYSAFANTDVPVPRMRWLEKGSEVLGAPFFIMDRILGCESNARRLQSPEYSEIRPAIAREMYKILAGIHALDWTETGVAGLGVPPAPEECWVRELDYWEGMIDANELTPQPIARAAIRWLRANPPPVPRRVTVVHGDYRVGNFLYRQDGIHGILDWEMAHLGDPMEDLAWSFMGLWEWGATGLKGGIVAAEEAIEAYECAAGQPVDRDALHWWDVFSGVKGQAIWLTGARTFQDGRSREMMLAYTSWALINRQDEILLRSMGRGR